MHVHIVFHTHWDREWYLPFENFRNRLCTVMERILFALEHNEIEKFVLDGQIAALEDYLEICEEEEKERLLSFIHQGRVIIGPWYVLADEFLVSGESLYRNLELGIKRAQKYGVSQKVGYLPDTFGHSSQVPQILRKFEIDSAVLWRGVVPSSSEFLWKSPDGSSVFTVFLSEGYYQPIIDRPDYEKQIQAYIERLQKHSPSDLMILPNGGDHLMPQHINIRERMLEIKERFADSFTIAESDFVTYIKEAQSKVSGNIEIIEGELRNNQKAYMLPNVLSTRSYLKVQNQFIEDELTGYTEPLLTLTSLNKDNYPTRYLEKTWEYLLKNHPHDSICGCSVDEVHSEMETRTMKLSQRLTGLQEQALLNGLAFDSAVSGNGKRKPFDDYTECTIFNPHPHPFTGWVRGVIWLQKNEEAIESVQLKSKNGERLDSTVIKKWEGTYFYSPVDEFPTFIPVTYFEVAFYVKDLPGLSLQTIHVTEETNTPIRNQDVQSFIENEFLSVQVEKDGTLTLFDKVKGSLHKQQHQFYSSMDAGDEYTYSPPEQDVITLGKLDGNPQINIGDGIQILTYDIVLCVPKELHANRITGVQEKVTSKISVEIALCKNEPDARVKVTIRNSAKDHRIRVKFPVGENVDCSYSDTAFDFVKRNAKKQESFLAQKQQEVPVVVEPSYSTIFVPNEQSGLFLYQRGLQEYQITNKNDMDYLEVTLLRSVGWLSRDDLRTRGGGAGPHLPTPEAQCIGEYTFQYAFGFTQEGQSHGELLSRAHFFRVPPKIYRALADDKMAEPLFQIDNQNIQWSTIRTKDKMVEIRLWNPASAQAESFKIMSREQIHTVQVISVHSTETSQAPEQLFTIKPKEIVTLLINFKN